MSALGANGENSALGVGVFDCRARAEQGHACGERQRRQHRPFNSSFAHCDLRCAHRPILGDKQATSRCQ
jgi:hypothetical protein